MGVYQKLYAKAQPGPSDQSTFGATLGGRVMAEAVKKGWNAKTHMPEILDAFHRALVHFNWRWTPRKGCGDPLAAAKTLDGEIVHAECYVPANAFYQLLLALGPWGFGVPDDQLSVKTYSGEKSIIGGDPAGGPKLNPGIRRANDPAIGFISPHPAAGVHHLPPNVFDVGAQQMAELYAWYDHKVVKYAGRYWDPCYNKSYIALQQMALALRIGANEDGRPTKTLEEAMKRVDETKVMVMNWHQAVYFRDIPMGEVRGGVADVKVEGPFGQSLFGDEDSFGDPTPIIKWGGPE